MQQARDYSQKFLRSGQTTDREKALLAGQIMALYNRAKDNSEAAEQFLSLASSLGGPQVQANPSKATENANIQDVSGLGKQVQEQVQGADLPGAAPSTRDMQQAEQAMHIQQPGTAQDVVNQGKEWRKDVTDQANANLAEVNKEQIDIARQRLANMLKYKTVSTQFTDRASGIIRNGASFLKSSFSWLVDRASEMLPQIKAMQSAYKAGQKIGRLFENNVTNQIVSDANSLLKVANALQLSGQSKNPEIQERLRSVMQESGMADVLKNENSQQALFFSFRQYAIDQGADQQMANLYASARMESLVGLGRNLGFNMSYQAPEHFSTGDKLLDQAVLESAQSGHDAYLHQAIAIRRAEQHTPEMPSSGGITGPKWYDSQNPKPKSVSAQEMALQEKLLNPQSRPAPPKKLGPDA
jgi:hypothetical protein